MDFAVRLTYRTGGLAIRNQLQQGPCMIPLKDNIPSRSTPVVNYLMIAACLLTFLLQLADQKDGQDELVQKYGMLPVQVLHPGREVMVREAVPVQMESGQIVYVERERVAAAPTISPWLTLLTCTFLHGGWMHFLGNMWFLWIFGDNVEDRFGHVGYLLLYLGCGIAASAMHLLTNMSSEMPTVGASGAIAGVMGAYLFLYPHARVLTLVPIVYFMQVVVIPAPIFLGVWFLIQFFQGAMAITATETGGVAWWAHIGGFVAGLGAAYILEHAGRLRPPVEVILPNTDRMRSYRFRAQ